MMNILITGAAGFLGKKLAEALVRDPACLDDGIRRITLVDLIQPADELSSGEVEIAIGKGDINDPGFHQQFGADADVIFHLAAVVSAAAEADFEFGMKVNLDGTRRLLESCRIGRKSPRLVMASSVAVFGGEVPEVIDDRTIVNPQSSYGTQKAIAELLVNDYSRRGFVDGCALRLPTVTVRPGKPNKAASSFASGIIREPIGGVDAVCPVSPQTKMWVSSPRQVIRSFIHAARLEAKQWGQNRAVSLPGLTVSVAEMVRALETVTDKQTTARIKWEPDPTIEAIVGSWPGFIQTDKAIKLGFESDSSMEEIIQAYIDDELAS